MKTKNIYSTLYDLCRWEMNPEVKERLMDSPNYVDVAYDGGLFFRLGLSAETTELLTILLDYYYDQHDLRKPFETYNISQKEAKYKLEQILQDAVISEEMDKLLDNYFIHLNENGSSVHSEEEAIPVIKNYDSQGPLLTESALKNEAGDVLDRKSEYFSIALIEDFGWVAKAVEAPTEQEIGRLMNDLTVTHYINHESTSYNLDLMGNGSQAEDH